MIESSQPTFCQTDVGSSAMKFKRVWAMPDSNTFNILPIKQVIYKYIDKDKIWIDPFARDGVFKSYCKFTNDLNPEFVCTHNMDAYEFLKTFETDSVDGVLFDPPYSLHQIVEKYQDYGGKQLKKVSACYKEISRILKPNGIAMHFGWNSNGCGANKMFEILEVLLVAHGGSHNDTIITVERKFCGRLF